jgi:fructose-1,6-bisphosphatase I
VFDPLDGSSNVDAGIPTGTIFGIFDEVSATQRDTAQRNATPRNARVMYRVVLRDVLCCFPMRDAF